MANNVSNILNYGQICQWDNMINAFPSSEEQLTANIARSILDQGIDLYATLPGSSGNCLHKAVAEGRMRIVQILVKDAKMNINCWDTTGEEPKHGPYTPLHIAVGVKNLPMVQFLLQNGANVNAQKTPVTVTPFLLHVTTPNGQTPPEMNICSELLNHGADPLIEVSSRDRFLSALHSQPFQYQ